MYYLTNESARALWRPFHGLERPSGGTTAPVRWAQRVDVELHTRIDEARISSGQVFQPRVMRRCVRQPRRVGEAFQQRCRQRLALGWVLQRTATRPLVWLVSLTIGRAEVGCAGGSLMGCTLVIMCQQANPEMTRHLQLLR